MQWMRDFFLNEYKPPKQKQEKKPEFVWRHGQGSVYFSMQKKAWCCRGPVGHVQFPVQSKDTNGQTLDVETYRRTMEIQEKNANEEFQRQLKEVREAKP